MHHPLQRCLLLLAALVLAACGNTGEGAQPGVSSGAAAASNVASSGVASAIARNALTAEASTAEVAAASIAASASAAASPTAGPTPIPTPGPDEFVNPVIAQDFPDPDVLKAGDTYYAYATGNGHNTFQTARSPDLVQWERLGDAMPAAPRWTKRGRFYWAPEVTSWDDGKTFTMYFTARDSESDKQCIGVATSDKPEGPFSGVGDEPFICQAEIGGSIDASSFTDEDGSQYVLWKNDGNCCGFDTFLYIQKVSRDGLTLEGEATPLIKQHQAWEGWLVEAPTLWKHDGKYYLFYSANAYDSPLYAVGYASADTILGSYTKASDPLLKSDYKTGAAIGPGGQDIVIDDDGETWIAYHSWNPTVTMRHMLIDELVWEGDTPVVKGPDKGPQPKP